jgi:hemolysin activation/secretion protein
MQAGAALCRSAARLRARLVPGVFLAASVDLAALGLGAPALASDAAAPTGACPQTRSADGPSYLVSSIEILYQDPNPQFPPPEEMALLEVELGEAPDGFVMPRPELPSTRLRIADVAGMGLRCFYASAIRAVNQQLVFDYNRRDFHAIVVSPLPEDIERRTGRDLRPPGQTRFRLGVYAGRVKDLRTFGSGDRWGDTEEERLDLAEHRWIRDGSPIQPGTPDDLVRKDRLDAYLARINRNSNRRVDAEISPAREAGGVYLDYLVAESRPWWAYTQLEDTGTEETTERRERFGFVHTQLTGRDDVLQLDYITGDFDEVHATLGSYEFPFRKGGRLRARVLGAWSDYDASVLGFPDVFSAEQRSFGGQLIANAVQWEDLFLDLIVGARADHIRVKNDLAESHEAEDFLLGLVGARVERLTIGSNLFAEVALEHNFADIAETEAHELPLLGRIPLDQEDFSLLRWDADFSFFVEPLLNRRSWRDPSTLDTTSLAHEIAFSFQGQNGLGNRLIPQQEQVAGGFYSVRGYPEASAVGDDVETVTAEYRLHLPRLLGPSEKPVRLPVVGEFRARPQYAYTFADWDLILRAFYDWGHVDQVHRTDFERSETLRGIGLGLELRLGRHLTARCDWGRALTAVNEDLDDEVDEGNDEYHFSVTILY